jgi:hypothetical protein
MQARLEKDFVGVDIADSGDEVLPQQEAFQRSAARPEEVAQQV